MHFRRILACWATLAIAGACGRGEPSSAAGAAPDGGTLVIAEPGDADVLFPPLTVSIVGHQIADLLYDHLAEIGDGMQTIGDQGFKPQLADHWTWAPDSMSVAFHIDPRARWHDGVPVRAADVRFSLDLYKNPKLGSPVAPLLTNVDSVSLKDSLTAVAWFHAKTPESFFNIVYQLWVLPQHLLDTIPPEKLATSEAARHPVGSGRFRFVRWEPGSRLEIVADTGNYRGRARLDRVIWAISPDNNAAFTQILSGDADMLENATPDQLKAAAGHAGLRPFLWPSLQYVFLGMNFRDATHSAQPSPYFADVRVRRALSMAIDRRAMLRNVFDSLGAIGYGPFPASLATADTSLRLPPYDPAYAAALLDSAGWAAGANGVRAKNGKPLAVRLLVPTSSAFRMSYAVLVQDALRKAGIKVDIDAEQFPSFVAKQTAGNFDLVLAGYGTDPNAGGAKQNWGSTAVPPAGFNYLHYRGPAFDALLDSASSSFDPAKAKAYAARAYQAVADDAPGVWLYDVVSFGIISTRFHMPAMRADGWWQHLADWTVPADARIPRDRIGLGAPKP
ncbi:MAG TPA: peptide ABC transporter substrate-binding protein [Gemmatimonadaceae bacterium]|nr:peptide ABC transporter substrate-binding protein [Gemmatimonadaceae bacterium]